MDENIIVEHNPADERLKELGVFDWDIWTKEVSEFTWFYDEKETCYFLQGEVTVTPDGGAPLKIKKGDLVIFPEGMACTWKVSKPVRKHYLFG